MSSTHHRTGNSVKRRLLFALITLGASASHTLHAQELRPQRLPLVDSFETVVGDAFDDALMRTVVSALPAFDDISTTNSPVHPDWLDISLHKRRDRESASDQRDLLSLDNIPTMASKPTASKPTRLPLIDDANANQDSPSDFAAAAGMSVLQAQLNCTFNDFSATPLPQTSFYHDPYAHQWIYDSKHTVPTQSPWIEWGRPFYGDGITPRGIDWFGPYNMIRPQFYVYGDYRTGIAAGRNAAGRTDNWSSRLNLDMDFRLTDTERFHGFVGPLNRANQFSGLQLIDGEFDYQSIINPNLVTGFFEGDLGVMMGAMHNKTSPAEIPFTVGLVPLLFQNGIWMEDAVTGAAFALPSRHSRLLNWNNYDLTFFAVADQLNSPAFGKDNHAAQAFGSAIFIDAYDGYIESGYAFVRDRNNPGRSYHNMTTSYTRRYFDRVSNSVRVIINEGQDGAKADRTADGGLLLLENSWITAAPLTLVPYANFFYGWGRPQSVARAANSGGILRNTGINFDTDGLNGLATLDTTAADTAGGSVGVDLIGNKLDRQLLLEASYLTEHGDSNNFVSGDQFGLGARYQFPVSNAHLLRFDVMHGWRGDLPNVYGTRMEYRWKF